MMVIFFGIKLNPDTIYILSAKYGLLDLDAEIDPYNQTLNTMPAAEIRSWAERVLLQLRQVGDLRADHFILLAGMKYRKYLLPHMSSYEIPLEGLTIGKQLRFLSRQDGIDNDFHQVQPSGNFSEGNRRFGMAG
jgi:hypothetical protein